MSICFGIPKQRKIIVKISAHRKFKSQKQGKITTKQKLTDFFTKKLFQKNKGKLRPQR
jgi:hypothetical protein